MLDKRCDFKSQMSIVACGYDTLFLLTDLSKKNLRLSENILTFCLLWCWKLVESNLAQDFIPLTCPNIYKAT